MVRLCRRLGVAFAVLALAAALTAHGIAAAAMGKDLAVRLDMTDFSSAHCDAGDDAADAMSATACHALCAGAMAVLAAATAYRNPNPGHSVSCFTSEVALGHNCPPDLAPPRPDMAI